MDKSKPQFDKPKPHFDDWDDYSFYKYMKSLNLDLWGKHDGSGTTSSGTETVDDCKGLGDDGRPPPWVERKRHIVDVNIKCFFCRQATQTAGEHTISNFPCGLVFGYSCVQAKLRSEDKSCPGCGEIHLHHDVTQLDIGPEQMTENHQKEAEEPVLGSSANANS
ncbi:uncharacterized protein LOC131001759 [Salvia miltiorrhiza]|uniref:uncharacterized protein LOC131001759 n=1 Tax=Salvia miltiorrhiza TaxID=226208 RepID=UPI0025AD7E9B|nr:uncharacterized protein LOC131001759 [Salvia miltiorrhiza]